MNAAHKVIKEFYDANNKFDLIDLNNFKLISHWQPFAVLNLLKLKDFQFEYECVNFNSKTFRVAAQRQNFFYAIGIFCWRQEI